jgi:AcrR family transcriptional regulator
LFQDDRRGDQDGFQPDGGDDGRRENADCADLRIVPTLGRFPCFTDKRDLVNAAYTEVGDPPGVPLEAAADAADPLLSTLEALLPLDEDRIRDWRLLFTFLGLAATDAALTAEQRSRVTTARARIEQAIAAEQEAGHLRTDIDAEATGRFLLAVVLGRRSSTRPAGPKIASAAGCTAH